ncbi:MAG: TIGR02186 family protein, partial [Pseudomonadota bacterium]|nr:TIGR02186 family protein [Pseudomonadota bacterium]
GFERFVEVFADREPLFYGLVAIALSLFMGWLAGRLFNRS